MFILRNGIIGEARVGSLVVCLVSALLAANVDSANPDLSHGQSAPPVIFENVRVFDGEEIIAETQVVIQDGIIAGVGQNLPTPEGAELIDGQGLTLLPGLMDAHVHIWAEDQLRQALIFGVTSVVDMFMDSGTMRAIEEKQAASIVGSVLNFV